LAQHWQNWFQILAVVANGILERATMADREGGGERKAQK